MNRPSKSPHIWYVFMLLSAWVWGFPSPLWASSLTVLPADGSGTLRFGRADLTLAADKQVRLRVSSSEGQPYQVYQRILEPLTNERGQTLDRSVMLTGTLPGSNASGTLYLQNPERLSLSENLVYSSDASGSPDAFTLYYQINPEELRYSGTFSGQVMFTLRPLGSGTPDEQVLNLSLEAAGDFKTEVETSDGERRVRVKTDQGAEEAYVRLMFSGRSSGRVRVSQDLLQPLADVQHESLGEGVLTYTVVDAQGSPWRAPEVLTERREDLYEGDELPEVLSIVFSFTPDAVRQKAGVYRGLMVYTIDNGGIPQDIRVDLEAEISPVFYLEVLYPSEGVNFQKILPQDPPQEREVELKVHSNTGQPYVITQSVISALASERGQEFPEQDFRMGLFWSGEEHGTILAPDNGPVTPGDKAVYQSDSRGTPVALKARYRISPAARMQPGDYKTMIRFSLETR